MFYSPLLLPINSFERQKASPFSYVRLFHAVPDAPPVDVYAGGNLIARNISYRNFTPYIPLRPGNYPIDVFPAGQTINPVLRTTLSIPVQSILTYAATGRVSGVSLLQIPDTPAPLPKGVVYLRFVHLSPNAPPVDVTTSDGSVLFRDMAYREIPEYIPVNAGNYTFNLSITGTGQRILYVPNIRLKPNRFYTIYAVGLAGAVPPLQVLIPLDGNSYIKFS
ncbi:MAG: DUF4397 domain-containing protein [Clostridia bacterium]|nr:DUF4397 domain-containing protein [Clostridia bacterium]